MTSPAVAPHQRSAGSTPGASRRGGLEDSRVEWARNGDVLLAYQIVSDGDVDLLLCGGTMQHIEAYWDHPEPRHLLDRLSRLGRLILTDKRGVGLSERPMSVPPLEERVDDLMAVLRAAGSARAVVLTVGEPDTTGMAAMLAATQPGLVSHLVLYQPVFRVVGAGASEVPPEMWRDFVVRTQAEWGTGAIAGAHVPHLAERQDVRRWLERAERRAGTPRWRATLAELFTELDLASVYPAVSAPTLVLRRADSVRLNQQGPLVAAAIPGAQLVELDGQDNLNLFDGADGYADAVAHFLDAEASPADSSGRMLATMLFTDIVRSTERAAAVGDGQWRAVLDFHDAITTEEVTSYRGRVVKTTGDGVLAVFDGPARAVQCALRLHERLADRGLELRSGLHAGEVETRGDDIGGVAVHVAARIMAHAQPGVTLASRTVRDLTVGSELCWRPLGAHQLKGVPDNWELFAASLR